MWMWLWLSWRRNGTHQQCQQGSSGITLFPSWNVLWSSIRIWFQDHTSNFNPQFIHDILNAITIRSSISHILMLLLMDYLLLLLMLMCLLLLSFLETTLHLSEIWGSNYHQLICWWWLLLPDLFFLLLVSISTSTSKRSQREYHTVYIHRSVHAVIPIVYVIHSFYTPHQWHQSINWTTNRTMWYTTIRKKARSMTRKKTPQN